MTYSYRNQALIDLPMRFAQHDIAYVDTTEELVEDWDMSAAGTADWNAVDSTLAKDTTAPLYPGSTQHLRITSTTNTFWATQVSVFTVGRQYRVRCAARSVSGGAVPRVYESGGGAWTGTASTDWQYFEGIFTPGGTTLFIGSSSLHPGVVDFAFISVMPVVPRILNQGTAGSDGDMTFGDGVTAARYPTKLNRKGYVTDGGDDFKGVASVYTTTGLLDRVSLGVVAKFPDNAGTYPIASYEVGTTIGLVMLNVLGDMRFYCGGSAANNAARLAITPRVFHSIVGVWDGSNTHIYIDGTHHAVAVTPAAVSATATMRSSIFSRQNAASPCPAGTEIAQYSLWNFALSATQVNDFHIEMMKKIGKI